MQTEFSVLAQLCEKLEDTKKRKLMVDLVASFLRKLSLEEIESGTIMLLGRSFSKKDSNVLEVSWATIRTVVKNLIDVDC